MNCTDLCGCSDTGEGCEAEYEYISDSDDDLDGEFNKRLLVNLDSAAGDKYP